MRREPIAPVASLIITDKHVELCRPVPKANSAHLCKYVISPTFCVFVYFLSQIRVIFSHTSPRVDRKLSVSEETGLKPADLSLSQSEPARKKKTPCETATCELDYSRVGYLWRRRKTPFSPTKARGGRLVIMYRPILIVAST